MAEVAAPCLPHLDSLVINELEAGCADRHRTPRCPGPDGPVDWPALEAMAERLIGAWASSTLAVVHFPAGCVAAAPGGRIWRQGSVRMPREQVRSTIGAGDAFAAGVDPRPARGLAGASECLRLGVASAAACVRSTHTSDGIQRADACLAAAERLGYRATT